MSMHPMMRVQDSAQTYFALSACIAGGRCSSQQRQVFADLVHYVGLVRSAGRAFPHSQDTLPEVGEDTGGGADEVGAAGVVGDERDDENGGVGQGDLAGHGQPAGQGRALQLSSRR